MQPIFKPHMVLGRQSCNSSPHMPRRPCLYHCGVLTCLILAPTLGKQQARLADYGAPYFFSLTI